MKHYTHWSFVGEDCPVLMEEYSVVVGAVFMRGQDDLLYVSSGRIIPSGNAFIPNSTESIRVDAVIQIVRVTCHWCLKQILEYVAMNADDDAWFIDAAIEAAAKMNPERIRRQRKA